MIDKYFITTGWMTGESVSQMKENFIGKYRCINVLGKYGYSRVHIIPCTYCDNFSTGANIGLPYISCDHINMKFSRMNDKFSCTKLYHCLLTSDIFRLYVGCIFITMLTIMRIVSSVSEHIYDFLSTIFQFFLQWEKLNLLRSDNKGI